MDSATVLERLREMGTEQNRKVYPRHGLGNNVLGVSFANIGKLRKAIKKDQAIADELWETGIFEPQTLACMVADAAAFNEAKVERWAREASSHGVADEVAKQIAVKTPWALTLARKWIASHNPLLQRAGWTSYALLAMSDEIPDKELASAIEVIEHDIHHSENRTKEGMNNALIAIGGSRATLRNAAVAAAERIGKVEVDHGQTNCKTPFAVPYIEKMWARRG